jgi:DNA ligase-1
MYLVFDYLTLDEFNSGTGTRTLSERNDTTYDFNFVKSLQFEKVTDFKVLQEWADEAESLGHEGIMIRKDCEYKGKRSNDILKVKKMHDAEYVVVDLDFGEHRIIENSKEVKRTLLSQVYIEHKGNRVGVGSGFSKEQRMKYYANPEWLIGKTITVQYFEETINEEGLPSLRFPVVKHIYKNGRDC